MSKSADTKHAARQNFWLYCHRASKDFAAFHFRFRPFPASFPPPFRFGEGAFRPRPRDPQVENVGTMTIFSGHLSFRLKSMRYALSPTMPKGSWVTLPPAIVSAIPVFPT